MRHTPGYVVTDPDEIKRLIRDNPWATIVSNTATGLVASHYPVLLEEDRDEISIVSHMASSRAIAFTTRAPAPPPARTRT